MDDFGYIDWLTYPTAQREAAPAKIDWRELAVLRALFEAAGCPSVEGMLAVAHAELGKAVARLEDLTLGDYGRLKLFLSRTGLGPAA